MPAILKDELDFYMGHQAELVAQHVGKVLVIKNQRVLGVYPDKLTAITETEKVEHPGTFMVILCAQGDGEYTRRFRSRVFFEAASA